VFLNTQTTRILAAENRNAGGAPGVNVLRGPLFLCECAIDTFLAQWTIERWFGALFTVHVDRFWVVREQTVN